MENIMLQPKQQNLLRDLIEADQKVLEQKFMILDVGGEHFLRHDGITNSTKIFIGDIETLADAGLIKISQRPGKLAMFHITPLGYTYYNKLKLLSNQGIEPMDTTESLNLVLATINRLQGESSEFVNVTKIITEPEISPQDTQNYLTRLIKEGKVEQSKYVGEYGVRLTAEGKIFLRDPNYTTQHSTATSINLYGTYSGTVINIASTLKDVTQTINTSPNLDQTEKDKLIALIKELEQALEKAPPEAAEDADAIAESAKDLLDAATKDKPNRRRIQITKEGLELV